MFKRLSSVSVAFVFTLSLIMVNFASILPSYANTVVGSYTELVEAINRRETQITLRNDIEIPQTITILPQFADNITITGNGNSLISGSNLTDMFMVSGQNKTLNFIDMTFDGRENGRFLHVSDSATVNIRNSTIKNGVSWKENVSDPATGYSDGGAIYIVSNANLDVDNSTFLNNKSVRPINVAPTRTDMNGHGGAIYGFRAGRIAITNSTVENNVSGVTSGGGFAYLEEVAHTVVTSNTFTGNHTNAVVSNNNQGGIFHVNGGDFSSSRNTYNVASTFNTGGALYLANITGSKKATSENDTFKMDNLGDGYGISGGAILSSNTNLTVTGGTFTVTGNSKVTHAGGIVDIPL